MKTLNNTIIKNIFNTYSDEPVRDIKSLTGGHINETFLVRGRRDYVLQRLAPDLYEGQLDTLVKNHELLRMHLPDSFPKWIRNKEGSYFSRDDEGGVWRLYKYIPSEEPVIGISPDHLEIGRGLGSFHRVLENCTGIIGVETTAHLHDLEYHYGEYLKEKEPAAARVEELDMLIEREIEKLLGICVPGGKIIHGDARIGNMIIKEGRVAGFIDLDTVMEGSVFDDIADCARSCCINDEGDLNAFALALLIKGYEEGAGRTFTDEEDDLIAANIVKNRFMLGLRYYTDYLSGRGYFAEEYPGQSLDKARKLLGKMP